jgi:hypothetical protein
MAIAFTIQGETGSQSSVAQYAQAIPRSFGGSLVSTDHTVELAGGRYTHYFWVRNETAGNAAFPLHGGKVFIKASDRFTPRSQAAREGLLVHEVNVPDALLERSAEELHEELRVRLGTTHVTMRQEGTLMGRRPPKTCPAGSWTYVDAIPSITGFLLVFKSGLTRWSLTASTRLHRLATSRTRLLLVEPND